MPHIHIISKLTTSFEAARRSGDLLFFPSTITKHTDSDVEYEIRLCPALQHKAIPPKSITDPEPAYDDRRKDQNPFAPPYNKNLYIGELKDEETQEEFVLLLNKYSVVPQHFLMITKEYKPQTSPLLPSELVQAYSLLLAARESGQRFFAFYNCGKNSGASQAHKHIQFLPIENSEDGPPIEISARKAQITFPDRPFSLNHLSYANHCYRLPSQLHTYGPDQLETVLAQAFLQLLDLAISTIRHDESYPVGSPAYNVILTLEHLHVIPRGKEEHILKETGGKLSVNALGFAGMLLVKSDEELEAVKKESISKILRDVALESVHDIQVDGASHEAPLAGHL
ncbi:ATP adenylyltransferase [Pholiota conissans]|uniref:ATP adenylyltransferase n=1 Tax=Pholiota conissans TaxID=109636 RepID=A0A9P6CTU5_9AGAR|nr:ATP adenylyltransferase [Pholiota conissans]